MSAQIIAFPTRRSRQQNDSPLLDLLATRGVYPDLQHDPISEAIMILRRGQRVGFETEDWSMRQLIDEMTALHDDSFIPPGAA